MVGTTPDDIELDGALRRALLKLKRS